MPLRSTFANYDGLVNDTKPRASALVLSGGGTLGTLQASMINGYENALGSTIAESVMKGDFTHAYGISAGAINAMALWPLRETGQPIATSEQLIDYYVDRAGQGDGEIFEPRLLGGIWGSVYSQDNLKDNLHALAGDIKLSDFEPGLVIFVADRDSDGIRAFSSDEAALDPSKDFYIADLATAASSAPVYFGPAEIQAIDGTEYMLADAGMTTPSFHALMHLEKELGVQVGDADIIMTRFGTGYSNDLRKDWMGGVDSGVLSVGKAFRSYAQSGNHDLEAFVDSRLGQNFNVIDTDISGLGLDSESNPSDILKAVDGKLGHIPIVSLQTQNMISDWRKRGMPENHTPELLSSHVESTSSNKLMAQLGF